MAARLSNHAGDADLCKACRRRERHEDTMPRLGLVRDLCERI